MDRRKGGRMEGNKSTEGGREGGRTEERKEGKEERQKNQWTDGPTD